MTAADRPAARLPSSLVVAAPAIVIATLFLLRGLLDGPTLDGSIFALIGNAVAHGQMPYRDVWDHKPPGVFVANGLAGIVLPFLGVWARAWLVSWLSTIGAMAALAVLLIRSGVERSGIVLSLLIALPMVAAYHFALGGGQTESVGLGFAVAGIALAVRRSDRSQVAAGIALAAAVAISLQFVPALAGAVVVAARGPSRWRALVALGAGVVAVPVATIAWLAINGALPDAFDAVIDYNRIYLAANQQFRESGLLTAAIDGLFMLPLVVAALARIASFRRQAPNDLEVAAAVWALAWLVFTGLQGLFFDHYATAVAPALVILAAPTAGAMLRAAGSRTGAPVARAVVLAMLVLPAIVGTGLTEGSAHPATSLGPAATEIRQLTAPSDSIFVWGNEAALYFEADRPQASRFVYMFPLTLRGYATPALIDGILARWSIRPPRIVIDTTVNPGRVGGYPLTGSSGAPDRPDAILDPLRDFILSRYQLKESVGSWDLYTLQELAGR